MMTAIVVLIIVSLIPLSFKSEIQNDESDEVIPSLSLPLMNEQMSNTYFNVHVEMNVSTMDEAFEQLNVLVQQASGTVMSYHLSAVDETLGSYSGSYTLEVEANAMEEFLAQSRLIGQVTRMETYTNSEVLVTEDVDSWLSNLKMQQSKYQTLLSEAVTISEIVKLEEELARIGVEIDKWSALKTQDELARNQVTITFVLTEGGTQSDETWSVMIQSELSVQLTRISEVAKSGLVKLIGLTPHCLILLVLVIMIRILFIGRKRKR